MIAYFHFDQFPGSDVQLLGFLEETGMLFAHGFKLSLQSHTAMNKQLDGQQWLFPHLQQFFGLHSFIPLLAYHPDLRCCHF
jgi:hypothetical protein